MTFYLCVDGNVRPLTKQLLLIMKLIVLLIVITVFQANAVSFAQTITLTAENKPLAKVMEEVKEQSGYHFFIAGERIAKKAVNASFQNAEINEAMEILTRDLGVEWVIKKKVIVLREMAAQPKPFFLAENQSIIQDRIVSGRVTDEYGVGLEGVTITVKGSTTTVITDSQGNYQIELPTGADILSFSMMGYKSVEQTVGLQGSIDVVLETSISDLDEVVVVGYGTQKKVTLTGAVGVIDSKKLENRPVGSVVEALQGQVPGLNVVRTSGQPGNQEIDFRIRGTSTFSNNPVLTIIDGIPSSLDRINPADIESISVLKDAASAAIYGSRATGGVILVTTKTGKSGKARVSLTTSAGIQQPTRFPKKVSALEHALLSNEARENDGNAPKFLDTELFSSPSWVDRQWDDYMMRNAFQTDHNLSISGGNEGYDYYLSFGYLKQEGIIINSDFERVNVQLNQNLQISDKFKLGLKAGYIPSVTTAPAGGYLGSMLANVASLPNIYQLKTDDGRWLATDVGGNSIAMASEDGGHKLIKGNRLSGNVALEYNIIPQLKLTGNYGFVRNQSRQRDYRKMIALYQQDNHEAIASVTEDNFLDVMYNTDIQQNVNLLANYSQSFGDHTLSVLGGITAEWFEQGNDAISTRDFLTDEIYAVNAGSNNPTFWNISGTASDWALASFISKGSYSYKDKYLVESTIRYDGSSRFSQALRWGLFPSASLGWVVTQESFLQDSRVIDFLKLRGSWARVGNQNVGFYPFANTLAQTNYYFNGLPQRGVGTAGAPNPLLTWETKEAINLGIDGRILGNLLEFSVDLFRERTSDILLQLPLPTTFGQAEPVQNAGVIDNKGWELELTHRNRVGAVNYGISFQISDVTNRVIDMGGISPRIHGNTITEEGYAMNEWYGLRSLGLFQSDQEVANAPLQNPLTSAGDIRFEENGGDPNAINSDDRVRLGRSDPRFPYGIRLNLAYKGFDFIAFGQGVMSHLVWSNGWTAHNFDRENSTLRTYHLDRWTPETPNARFPKTRMGSGSGNGINDRFSSFWLEDASYFRLKHIELGYRIPDDILRMNQLGVRVYASAENLLTFTKFLGYDPEAPTGTSERLVEARYPLAKVFVFGLNVNF